MAIFRLGKRIGPFDIRGGLSRGDLKSSSYSKTDRDPRFKQKSNPENTIGRFRAAMASAEGYARPAKFAIRIFPPTNLLQSIKQQGTTTNREGKTLDSEMYNGDGQVKSFTSGVLQNLNKTIGRQVNIHCDTVSMPGRDLQSTPVQYGTDVARDMVTGHAFAGNINATFYADKYLRERHFFEMWQKACVDNITHKVGYYNDYVGTMRIMQLSALQGPVDPRDGIGGAPQETPTYAIECTEVYPEQVGAVEYDYGSANTIVKINVQLQYRQWYNLTTESINTQPFGNSLQKLHDIKQRDTGLFGKLPPSLQRVGRSVFGQARTVMNPVGKIFKGKVFPPFT